MGNTIFKGGEMTININAQEIRELHPRILVLGVGGAGGNAINGMMGAGLQVVEYYNNRKLMFNNKASQ